MSLNSWLSDRHVGDAGVYLQLYPFFSLLKPGDT